MTGLPGTRGPGFDATSGGGAAVVWACGTSGQASPPSPASSRRRRRMSWWVRWSGIHPLRFKVNCMTLVLPMSKAASQ